MFVDAAPTRAPGRAPAVPPPARAAPFARADAPLDPLEAREAELCAHLGALARGKAEVGALVAQLERAHVPVDPAWAGVFEDQRVNEDPACAALAAAAEEAHRLAALAQARADQARRQDLERRVGAAAELVARGQQLAAQARELLAQAGAGRSAPVQPAAPRTAAPAARAEQRAQRRVKLEATVDFESDHNFFTGFSSDISEGGLFIATVDVLPLGSRVEVTFSIGDGPQVTVAGTVRWIRDILDDAAVMPGMGVQFDALPDGVRRGIHAFISARDALFFA
jgi:uncharacterized protein (TIGR02266 family)